MDFAKYPTHDPLRPLKLTRPPLQGPDVFALQTLLVALDGAPGTLDGILGPRTDAAILYVQADLGLEQDGSVGPKTWEAGIGVLSEGFRQQFGLPKGLPFGQLKHESSCYGGNYSELYDDGYYDAGVAQGNTRRFPAKDGFDVPKSIRNLCIDHRQFYDLFVGVPKRRRITLAVGAWNRPAYACYYARLEGAKGVKANQTAKPSAAAAERFNAYMKSATALLVT